MGEKNMMMMTTMMITITDEERGTFLGDLFDFD
jgi:hypothetical protein